MYCWYTHGRSSIGLNGKKNFAFNISYRGWIIIGSDVDIEYEHKAILNEFYKQSHTWKLNLNKFKTLKSETIEIQCFIKKCSYDEKIVKTLFRRVIFVGPYRHTKRHKNRILLNDHLFLRGGGSIQVS